MEEQILQDLKAIKEELQDIRGTLGLKSKSKYHPVLNKVIWTIKWLFPCIYHCEYVSDGKHMVSIWRSWLWFDIWKRTFIVDSIKE